MSAKSRRSSKAKAVNRPFKPDVLKAARSLAAQYHVILHNEDGHWYGRGLELPYVYGDGATPAQCLDDTRAALASAVAYLVEQGERTPMPASEGTRTQQVNIRLTAEERALFEAVAKRKGFQGISDFMRAAAIESAR